MKPRPQFYGLLAEFDRPEQLISAAGRAREAGFRRMDAYSPFPVEGLADALGRRKTFVPLITLIGGITGGSLGFALQYWVATSAYPLNIGGRPFNSWPSFIPITYELTILFAAFTAVLAMFALNGLPQPYHPVFNVPRFALATRDRFFLCIEARDPKFDMATTNQFLESLQPHGVYEVEP